MAGHDTSIIFGTEVPLEAGMIVGNRACFTNRVGDRFWGKILKVNKKTVLVSDEKFGSNATYMVDKALVHTILQF